MLSWEFPPRIVGGISPHVYNLSLELSKLGVDVCVLTCDFPGSPAFETIEGVKIYRVDSYKFPAPDFTSWVFMMNTNMKISAGNIVTANEKEISLIHAHDWLVADTAIGLKHILRKPLVTTLHSTEYGRRNGINSDYQRLIHETEKWLSYESWRVICCSNYMASHVHAVLNIPNNKLEVIPNGIDAKEFNYVYDRAGFRKRFVNSTEKLVLFTGRLVHEKGVLVRLPACSGFQFGLGHHGHRHAQENTQRGHEPERHGARPVLRSQRTRLRGYRSFAEGGRTDTPSTDWTPGLVLSKAMAE